MPRVVVFSVSSLCLAGIAVVGLAAYTSVHLPDETLTAGSVPVISSRHVTLAPDSLQSAPRTGRCAAHAKLVG